MEILYWVLNAGLIRPSQSSSQIEPLRLPATQLAGWEPQRMRTPDVQDITRPNFDSTEPTISKLWQKFNRWLTTLMKKYLSICHIRKQHLRINLTPSNKQRVCCCADWDLGYSDLILGVC